MAIQYPEQVLTIFIRNARLEHKEGTSFEDIFQGVKAHWQVFQDASDIEWTWKG